MTKLATTKYVVASMFFAISLPSYAGSDLSYIEKSLGTKTVRLPNLDGFSPACEENKLLAQKAAAMTPKTSVFITCFVDTKKWRNFNDGKSTDLYPLIAIAVQIPQPGGDFTYEEFKKIRTAAHNQLGDLLTDTRSTKRDLAEQDRKLASEGTPVIRKNYQQNLQGFFDPVGATLSFSYLVSRSFSTSETDATKIHMEQNAVSTIFYSGKLIGLSVVDQSLAEDHGIRVQKITASWLKAFRDLNEKSRN